MMRKMPALLLLPLLLAACDGMPRDAGGTSERISRTGTMRVIVLPATPDAAPALDLLGRYAAAHGATVARIEAHGEHALHMLEEGDVDAVVGHFAKASPWKTEIALSKPLTHGEPDDADMPVLRIARRNGENALVLATDRMVAEARR
jgi:hypothetical protein